MDRFPTYGSVRMILEMTIERLDPVTAVVIIDGSLTLGSNLKALDAEVRRLITDGVDRLILDLSGCIYSDSGGLGFLIHSYGLIAERHGVMRLCGVGERLLGMLKMTRTEDFIPRDSCRQESIDRIMGPVEEVQAQVRD